MSGMDQSLPSPPARDPTGPRPPAPGLGASDQWPRDPSREPSAAEKLEMVAQLMDLIPDFVYVHDYDMRFWYANRKAAEYFGRSKDDLIGRRLEDVDANKEQARFFVELCQQVMRSGTPRLTGDLPYTRPDGSKGFLRQHDIPFINPKTGDQMLMGLSRDVTSERELEAERLRRASLEREMEIARRIQRSLRPSRRPEVSAPAVDLAAHSEPATFAGGDFYDWFPTSEGHVAVCLGDVTGHGVGPALLAAECRAYARVLLSGLPLEAALRGLDALLREDLDDGRFVTFAAATVDPGSWRLSVLSAGQGPILVRRASGEVEDVRVHAPPLGIADIQPDGAPTVIALEPGDLAVAVSDGVIEARDAGGRQFATRRLVELLRAAPNAGAQELVDRIASGVAAHAGESGRSADDVTIVVAGRRGVGA